MSNSNTIEVPVSYHTDGSVDVDSTVENAEKAARDYQDRDATTTAVVIAATETALNNSKLGNRVTASTLAKMVAGVMDEVPTDKLCAYLETKVRALLLGRNDRFLHIENGRNSGFWFRDRLSVEETAKLTKTG